MFTKSKYKPKELKRKNNLYKKQARKEDCSKYITKKRLSVTKISGILSQGLISRNVLRGSLFKEETKARAEENLSKILQLAQNSLSIKENDYEDHISLNFRSIDSPEYTSNNFYKRYSRQFNKQSKLNNIGHRIRNYSKNDNMNSSTSVHQDEDFSNFNDDSKGSNSKLVVDNSLAKNTSDDEFGQNMNDGWFNNSGSSNKEINFAKGSIFSEQNEASFVEFTNKITNSLIDASSLLTKGYDIFTEIQDFLQDIVTKWHIQITPPSGSKGLSFFIQDNGCKNKNEDANNNGKKMKSNSGSPSSGVTLNESFCLFSHMINMSPQKVLRRYEQKKNHQEPLNDGHFENIIKDSVHSNNSNKLLQNNDQCENVGQKTVNVFSEINLAQFPIYLHEENDANNQKCITDPFLYLKQYENDTNSSQNKILNIETPHYTYYLDKSSTNNHSYINDNSCGTDDTVMHIQPKDHCNLRSQQVPKYINNDIRYMESNESKIFNDTIQDMESNNQQSCSRLNFNRQQFYEISPTHNKSKKHISFSPLISNNVCSPNVKQDTLAQLQHSSPENCQNVNSYIPRNHINYGSNIYKNHFCKSNETFNSNYDYENSYHNRLDLKINLRNQAISHDRELGLQTSYNSHKLYNSKNMDSYNESRVHSASSFDHIIDFTAQFQSTSPHRTGWNFPL